MAVKKSIRVLIVEDSSVISDVFKGHLNLLGYEHVDTAPDGLAALKSIEEAFNSDKPYHIVFSDYFMPNLDGLQLLKKLNEKKITEHLAFVLTTAGGESKIVLNFINEGAKGYIIKPITKEALKEKMDGLIKELNS